MQRPRNHWSLLWSQPGGKAGTHLPASQTEHVPAKHYLQHITSWLLFLTKMCPIAGQRAYLYASIMNGMYILGTNADCSAAASHANMHRSRQYTPTITATAANNFECRMSLKMLMLPAHWGQSPACRARLQLTGWLCGRQQVQGRPSSGCLQHPSHIIKFTHHHTTHTLLW